MRSRIVPGLAAMLVLTAGCGGEAVGAAGPSWFRAALEGEVTGSFEGRGNYTFERDYAETPYYFSIQAEGSDPETREKFFIRWASTERPSTGTYPLVPHDHRHGSSTGVTALYVWSRGDNVTAPNQGELYVASGGTIEITRSTRDVVEGTIRFSGIQTAKYGLGETLRDDSRYAPDPTAPKIEVAGTFRAPYWPGFGTP